MDAEGDEAFIMRCSPRMSEFICAALFALRSRQGKLRDWGARITRNRNTGEAVERCQSLRLFTVVSGDVYVASEIEKIKRLCSGRTVEIAAGKLQMLELRTT